MAGTGVERCDAKIELKAANSRVRRFLDAKARQLGVGKLVVVESRGRFVLMEHLSRAKCRWGEKSLQRVVAVTRTVFSPAAPYF